MHLFLDQFLQIKHTHFTLLPSWQEVHTMQEPWLSEKWGQWNDTLFPHHTSIDLLRAISEMLQTNNLYPIRKDRPREDRWSEKWENISGWTIFYDEGQAASTVNHFSCLIWRLNASVGRWGGVKLFLSACCQPLNLPDMLLFHFTEVLSRLPWSLVETEASLGFSQCLSRKGRAHSLFLPLFPYRESAVQFISAYLDSRRKHFSLQWITPDSCKVRPTSKRIPRGFSKYKHDFPGNS